MELYKVIRLVLQHQEIMLGQKLHILFPAIQISPFDNDNGTGLILYLIPFYGTNYTDNSKSVNAWSAHSTNYCPDMASTWLTAGASTFDVTGMQLEVGSVATDFEHRSFTDELLRCQRYYWRYPFEGEGDRYIYGGKYATSSMIHYSLPTKMRTTPTLTFSEKRSGSSSDQSYSDRYLLQYQQVGIDNGYLKNPKLDAEL